MIQASRTDESNNEFQITQNSLSDTIPTTEFKPAVWLNRARIIVALIYILLQIACLIFIIVCIVRFPRCQKAAATEWWRNGVILRLSNRTIKFTDLKEHLKNYKEMFSMHALWLDTVFPLSNKSNPLEWKNLDPNLGEKTDLTGLIQRAHNESIQVIVDYPINHLSVQSSYFTSNDDSYFVWNEKGNTSNWMTVDNPKTSAWTYNDKKNSFYLHQFGKDNDSIDINYRNNRVLNEMIDSLSYWNKNFEFDGFNVRGVSYIYEDYEYNNKSNDTQSRTRHLDEDYLLLARIRSEIEKEKILLLDTMDSTDTDDEKLLLRYYGDHGLGGVQLASINDFILKNKNRFNLTNLFDDYYNSIFFKENRFFVWSSLLSTPILNEAFFVTALFHTGTISIDFDRQGNRFTEEQLTRLRTIISTTRTSDVFRVGDIKQVILPESNLLTIKRTRRGTKNYMIIVNFNNVTREDKIVDDGIKTTVELFQSNDRLCKQQDREVRSIDLNAICLKPHGYVIIRWLPLPESLKIIF